MKYPIKLDQFLKLFNLVGSGGEAKIQIAEGNVMVNNALETRRGRKIQAGDVVELAGSEPVVAPKES